MTDDELYVNEKLERPPKKEDRGLMQDIPTSEKDSQTGQDEPGKYTYGDHRVDVLPQALYAPDGEYQVIVRLQEMNGGAYRVPRCGIGTDAEEGKAAVSAVISAAHLGQMVRPEFNESGLVLQLLKSDNGHGPIEVTVNGHGAEDYTRAAIDGINKVHETLYGPK